MLRPMPSVLALLLVAAAVLNAPSAFAQPLGPQMRYPVEPIHGLKSFGTSGKAVYPFAEGDKTEATLLEHEGAGCLTHMWFGGKWENYEKMRIRVYVDGEQKASIDMELFLGHGIGTRSWRAASGRTSTAPKRPCCCRRDWRITSSAPTSSIAACTTTTSPA